MREILFRGRRVDNGTWVYGTLFDISDAHNPFIMFTNQHGFSEQVLRETVGQYTGLKDCEGVQIFEGDIVSCADMNDNDYIGKVVFDCEAWLVAGGNYCDSLYMANCKHRLCVISDIYDEPELIGGVKDV